MKQVIAATMLVGMLVVPTSAQAWSLHGMVVKAAKSVAHCPVIEAAGKGVWSVVKHL